MWIRRRRGWELPEAAATPENVFHQRRQLIRSIAAGPVLMAGASVLGQAATADDADAATADLAARLYPVPRNERYSLDRPLSDERLVTTYNNFYEFGSHKQIWQAAQSLPLRPWTVTLDGLVEQEQVLDIDDLLARMPLEERLYRHRCVEAWSMAVPWSGFALAALVDLARPLGSAKYVRMETFLDPRPRRGSGSSGIPGPMSTACRSPRRPTSWPSSRQGSTASPCRSRTARRCASRCRGSTASNRSSPWCA